MQEMEEVVERGEVEFGGFYYQLLSVGGSQYWWQRALTSDTVV